MQSHATIIENLPFAIDEERVLREMRVAKIKRLDQMEERPLAESIKKAISQGYTLIQGKGIFKALELVSVSGQLEAAEAPGLFAGENMKKLLSGCPRATIMAVTIGPALEDEVARLDKAGQITEAYLLEMVGGMMADYMADRLDERIDREVSRAGFDRTMRYSPGYGDWPLDRQAPLHKLLGSERIGISVTDTHIMIPRKSVSAVLGWKERA